jgi:hypothetical protein
MKVGDLLKKLFAELATSPELPAAILSLLTWLIGLFTANPEATVTGAELRAQLRAGGYSLVTAGEQWYLDHDLPIPGSDPVPAGPPTEIPADPPVSDDTNIEEV